MANPETQVDVMGSMPVVQYQTLDSQRGNYLSFPKSNSGIWGEVVAAFPDAREFEPFIKCSDDSIIRCADGTNCFNAFFITGAQFYTDMDEKGVVHRTRLTDPNDSDFTEHWETILVVPVKEKTEYRCYPVKVTFRKAMVNAVRKMVKTFNQVANPDELAKWVKQSEAHALASKVNPPWARVFHRIRVTKEQGKKYTYPESSSVAFPINAEMVGALAVAHKNENFTKELKSVLRMYQLRVTEIKAVDGK